MAQQVVNVENPKFTASVIIDTSKGIAIGNIEKKGKGDTKNGFERVELGKENAVSISKEMLNTQRAIVDLAVQAGIPIESVRLVINLRNMYGEILSIAKGMGSMPELTALMGQIDFIVLHGGNALGQVMIGIFAGLRKNKIKTAKSYEEAMEIAGQSSAIK